MLHPNWFAKALFVLVFLPFFVVKQLCVKLVDVFQEQPNELVGGLLLVVGIDFCLNNRDGAVPKLRVWVGLASELLYLVDSFVDLRFMIDIFLGFFLLFEQLLVLLHFLVLLLLLVVFLRQLWRIGPGDLWINH